MEKHINHENNNNICKKRKRKTPDARTTPHFDYYPYSPVQSNSQQTIPLKCFSSEMIFNVKVIRNIILDHLEFSEENYQLLMFYGNDNYFKRRLRYINKTETKNIYQQFKKITCNFNFTFVLEFQLLLKAMIGQHQYQKLPQIPLPQKENRFGHFCGKETTFRKEYQAKFCNEITFEPMLNQKRKQFFEQFQIPLENTKHFRLWHNEIVDFEYPQLPGIFAETNSVTFFLNKKKELTLYSCTIKINSILHTHKLIPSLREVRIKHNTNIEIHLDHDPTNSITLLLRGDPSFYALLKFKIPPQNLSVYAWIARLETDLFQKFPVKFRREEIAFISKFKEPSYCMPNFKCVTTIDFIKKGKIQVTIEQDTYHFILKNNSYFQCTRFNSTDESTPNLISLSTSEIPTHWTAIFILIHSNSQYKVKIDTIPSTLNYISLWGGRNNTSTINQSDIPRQFEILQTSESFQLNNIKNFEKKKNNPNYELLNSANNLI